MRSFRVSKEDMLSHDNVERAFKKAARGKRNRADVKAVLDNLEAEIEIVTNMLDNGTFKPRYHKPVKINEKNYLKEREIIKPDYKYEQVVHHIVVQAIKPGIETGLYAYTLGSIPKRGTHMGKKQIERWLRKDPENTKYVFQMDIRHFFQSIDHDVLKAWLTKKYRDKYLLDLLYIIIDAIDDGVPLGFYTSQWFANFLLQPLDHYIKETLGVKYMVRYQDDIICFGSNKKILHKVQQATESYLYTEFKLTMKYNWQIFRFEYQTEELAIMCHTLDDLDALDKDLTVNHIKHRTKYYKRKRMVFIPIRTYYAKSDVVSTLLDKYHALSTIETMTYGRALDYMGFEFHRDKVIMRKSIMVRLTRRVRLVSKQTHINPRDASSVLSSMGWVKHTDTYGMYLTLIKPIINIRALKRIVSKHDKRRNRDVKLENSREYRATA